MVVPSVEKVVRVPKPDPFHPPQRVQSAPSTRGRGRPRKVGRPGRPRKMEGSQEEREGEEDEEEEDEEKERQETKRRGRRRKEEEREKGKEEEEEEEKLLRDQGYSRLSRVQIPVLSSRGNGDQEEEKGKWGRRS